MADSYFPDNLRAAMQARGYDRVKLASMIGAYPSGISRYLSGKQSPNAWTLARLASALEVSTDFLIFGESHTDINWIPIADIDNLSDKFTNIAVVRGKTDDGITHLDLAWYMPDESKWNPIHGHFPSDLKLTHFIPIPDFPIK